MTWHTRCFATGHTRTAATGPAVRLNMYRFETSYDLLITTHQPAAPEGKQKSKIETNLILFYRFGILDREL